MTCTYFVSPIGVLPPEGQKGLHPLQNRAQSLIALVGAGTKLQGG